ncbi:MAG: hypothetical protein IT384_21695 [Deltaproteobacteria bacterium]|nr:hypothetical protein [Deltaproteobacteria bacterium]
MRIALDFEDKFQTERQTGSAAQRQLEYWLAKVVAREGQVALALPAGFNRVRKLSSDSKRTLDLYKNPATGQMAVFVATPEAGYYRIFDRPKTGA